MKKSFVLTLVFITTLFLSACSSQQAVTVQEDVPKPEVASNVENAKSSAAEKPTDVKSGENVVRSVFSLALDEGVWLARIVPSQEKDVFFAVGFNDKTVSSPYQVYKISNNSVEKLVDLPFNTDTINNPYGNIDSIRFSNLIGSMLFIGMKSNMMNTDAHVATIDINTHQIYKSATLKDQKDAQLVLDNVGNSYVFSLDTSQEVFMQQITKDGEIKEKKDLGKKSAGTMGMIYGAIYHNGFFLLALNGPSGYTQSTLMQFDVNGSFQKSVVTDEAVFKLLSASRENVMALEMGGLESMEAQAVVYTSDLAKVKTFKTPSFYEEIAYQGSTLALSNDLLFLGKKAFGDTNKDMDIMRYSTGTEPSLLVRIKNDERPSAMVINLTNAFASSNKFYVGATEMTQTGEKVNSFFNLYEINLVNQ